MGRGGTVDPDVAAEIAANEARAVRIRRDWVAMLRDMSLVNESWTPSLADRWNGLPKAARPRIQVPKILEQTVDRYGVTMIVAPVPRIGAEEFNTRKKALRHAWQVREVKAEDLDVGGLIRIRAVYRNPLTETHHAAVPRRITDFTRIVCGPDEYGDPVTMSMADGASMVVGGNPGYGKSTFLRYLLTELAPNPAVQLLIANGKAPAPLIGDYRPYAPRASVLLGADEHPVYLLLEQLQAVMNDRYRRMYAERGTDQFWDAGPSLEWPLLFAVFDECQTWLRNPDILRLALDINQKCRQAGIFLGWATQKPTDRNLPTDLRDLATTSISFPVRTAAAAVASLGEDIREYPEMSPQTLMDPRFRGVGTLISETSPGFTHFKCPFTPADLTAAVAQATAHYTRDIPGITVGREHRHRPAPATPPPPAGPPVRRSAAERARDKWRKPGGTA